MRNGERGGVVNKGKGRVARGQPTSLGLHSLPDKMWLKKLGGKKKRCREERGQGYCHGGDGKRDF